MTFPLRRLATAALACLLAAATGGCGSDSDALARRCERVLSKTLRAIGGDALADPSIVERSTELCVREGLTDAQAACFEEVDDLGSLIDVADCEAIRESRPSWFRLPSSPSRFAETRRRIEAGRRAMEADRRRFEEFRRAVEEEMKKMGPPAESR